MVRIVSLFILVKNSLLLETVVVSKSPRDFIGVHGPGSSEKPITVVDNAYLSVVVYPRFRCGSWCDYKYYDPLANRIRLNCHCSQSRVQWFISCELETIITAQLIEDIDEVVLIGGNTFLMEFSLLGLLVFVPAWLNYCYCVKSFVNYSR